MIKFVGRDARFQGPGAERTQLDFGGEYRQGLSSAEFVVSLDFPRVIEHLVACECG